MGKDSRGGGPPDDHEESLVQHSGHFNYDNRPRKDAAWGVAFAIVLAGSVVGGIYAGSHRNHDFGVLFSKAKMQDPGTCPMATPGRRLLAEQDSTGFPEFYRSFAVALVGTVLASMATGIAFLAAFRYNPLLMVKLTIAIQVAIPAAAGLVLLAQGATWPALLMLFMAGLAGFAFYVWRDFIPLCARLLGVSAQGLNENPGVVVFSVLANVALACLVLPLWGISGLALTNGELVPNPARLGSSQCVDQQGQQVACCSWQADGWVGPFLTFNSVVLLWVIFLVSEIRVFVIASTIAQWYFAPTGSSTRGATMRGVRHAMGPSFGSLCFGSAILTGVQLVRNAMESIRQQNASNGDRDVGQVLASIAICLVSCILEAVLQLVEFLTKFATVKLAISGEHFLGAARSATDLLSRNFLKTYGVWFFPPLVLQTGSFLLSAVWGLFVFSLSWLGWHSKDMGTGAAIGMGALAFFLAWAVTSFFAGVLLSVVDAVYLCYAIDRDQQAVTKPEVHEVYSQVPVSQGIVVDQPGGSLAYGAPQQGQQQGQQQQGHYVPPASPSSAVHQGDSNSRV